MAKLSKTKVKGFLTQPVRMGFMTVPLWVLGAVFLYKQVKARRHRYA